MAIIRKVSSNSYLPAVCEQPGKIYLEGQAHDASTLSPIFNDSLAFITATTGNAVTQAFLSTETSRVWFKPWLTTNPTFGKEKMINYDLSLFDGGQNFVSQIMLDDTGNSLYIPADYIFEPSGGITRVVDTISKSFVSGTAENSVSGSANSRTVLVGQNSTKILLVKTGTETTANYGSLYHLSKSNIGAAAPVNLVNGNYSSSSAPVSLTVVDKTDTHLFVARHSPSSAPGQSLTLSAVGIDTLAVTNFGGITSGTNSHIYPSAGITISGANKVFYRALPTGSTSGGLFTFQVYQYNTNTLSTTAATVNATGDSGQPGQTSNLNNSTATPGRTWAFLSGNTIYVCVGVCSFSSGENTDVAQQQFYIHTYKTTTDAPTSLQYVSSTYLAESASRPLALIPQDNNFSKIIAPYNAFVNFLQWNLANETYDIVSTSPIAARSIGVDSTGRIWIISTAGAINLFSPSIANTVNVAFENTAITFAGSIINSNLIVSAFNVEGNRVATNVLLKIESNSAVFGDDTTSKTISTSASTDVSVPIKITGAGYIKVFASVSI